MIMVVPTLDTPQIWYNNFREVIHLLFQLGLAMLSQSALLLRVVNPIPRHSRHPALMMDGGAPGYHLPMLFLGIQLMVMAQSVPTNQKSLIRVQVMIIVAMRLGKRRWHPLTKRIVMKICSHPVMIVLQKRELKLADVLLTLTSGQVPS